MEKGMQKQNEMQDEEIYALLEQALEQERLCVSEELIQKTLKKIEEQGIAEQRPMQKVKKKYVFVRYASVAAAAVLIVALGIGMKDGIGMNKATEETMPEMAADHAGDSTRFEYSVNSSTNDTKKGIPRSESQAPTASDEALNVEVYDGLTDMAEPEEQPIVYLDSTVFYVSEVWEKTEADDTVLPEGTQDAEYWELVETEDDWMAKLTQCLAETKPKEQLLSETGGYQYALRCHDGSTQMFSFPEPLKRIVRISTEQGTLWCLFGETTYLYKEN